MAAVVARFNVTPVKSCAVEHPETIELTPAGARDDRRFVLLDAGGRLYNGKRDGRLARIRASWDARADVLELTLPDGTVLVDGVDRGPPVLLEVYGRRMTAHDIVGPWADALSDFAGQSLRLVERGEGDVATDVAPATMISRASLAEIDGDGRRFRMLIEVDGIEALGEEQWEGQRLGVGDAELRVGVPTPRCAVPTHAPDTGVRNRDTLREIDDLRGRIAGEICFGVYAEVVRPGVARIGDPVVELRQAG